MDDEVKDDSKEKSLEVTQGTESVQGSDAPTENEKYKADEISSSLKENTSLLYEIKEAIQNRLEYDDVKEKAFNKLYEEMKWQKEASNLLDRALKPVLSDLVLLYDSMKKFETVLINDEAKEETLKDLRYIIEELIEILYRQDVLPMDENTSDIFNSKIHKATKTENAENKDDDYKVVSIVRSGFTWRDKVLRFQEVVIKRYLNKL